MSAVIFDIAEIELMLLSDSLLVNFTQSDNSLSLYFFISMNFKFSRDISRINKSFSFYSFLTLETAFSDSSTA
jgi:hypothetical protein